MDALPGRLGISSAGAGPLWIFGAGSYGATVLELSMACGAQVSAVVDDNPALWGSTVGGVPVVSRNHAAEEGLAGRSIALALGAESARQEVAAWVDSSGGLLRTLVHPKAIVSPSANIGLGSLVHAGAIVWTDVTLGRGVFVSPGAGLAHHSSIGDFSTVSMGAVVGAGTSVGPRVLIGMGATIKTGVMSIGNDSVVGAGSVVTRDVGSHVRVAGVPARALPNSLA